MTVNRKRSVVLRLAAVALLAMASSSLPIVKATARNASEKEVCVWDDKEGKEKCKQNRSIVEAAKSAAAATLARFPFFSAKSKSTEESEKSQAEDTRFGNEKSANSDKDGDIIMNDEKVKAEILEKEKDYDQIDDNYSDEYLEWVYSEMYTYFGEFANIPEEGEEFDVWKHGTKQHLYQELNCPQEMSSDTSFETIHTTETWQQFNRIYNEVIAATQGDDELEQEPTIPEKFEKNGFLFPVEVKFDEVKGRGVYSKGHIPKGSLLYISTNNGAFLNGQTFRNFLKALPPKLACDVMIWAFVRWVSLESEETYEHMVCVDLDEGSFANSADSDDSYNMALGNDEGKFLADMDEEEEVELWHGCKMKFYAYKDIEPGQEILTSYGDFAEESGWRYLGLGI